MSRRHRIQLIDTHCGGDISRIFTGGIANIPGSSVREKMEYTQQNADGLRRLLLSPPYGRADMSVDLIVEPQILSYSDVLVDLDVCSVPRNELERILC